MMPQVDYRFEVDVLSDATSSLSFWPQVKDDPDLGPDEALRSTGNMVSPGPLRSREPRSGCRPGIQRLGRPGRAALVATFSRLTFIDDWLDEAERLDESWDWIAENNAADEANLVAARLFRTLDQFSLACHASRKLLGDDTPSEQRVDLDAIGQEVAEGERLLREQPDIFLGAAVLASAQLRQFRKDLLEHDDRLWETTLKYQVLEEVLEERDTAPAGRLTQREIDELLEGARTIEAPPIQEERRAEILQYGLKRFFGERSERAAAAAGGDRSLNEERLQIARLRGSVEGDPAVEVALIPEIIQGRRSGLVIRLFGEDVGRYIKAIVSLESSSKPKEVPLALGAGKLGEAESEALSQTDNLSIILRDHHDCERSIRW